jgi:hypothetical protein
VKEVFTKSFWQGVKRTFHDALEGRPPDADAAPTPGPDAPMEPAAEDARPTAKTSEES